jgi:hypothetical protein
MASAAHALLKDGNGVVLDVKSKLDRRLQPKEIELWTLTMSGVRTGAVNVVGAG